MVADATGNPVVTNSYDEYGRRGTTNQGRFQYTGQIWLPEVGLYHYKARMYSPTLGRFMQVDPVGYMSGMNLYAYVRIDPLNLVDIHGMVPGDPYLTANDASVDWQNFYNPGSIERNREYIGVTYELNGRFYATTGKLVTPTGGDRVPITILGGSRPVQENHTHGDYARENAQGREVRTTRTQDEFDSDNVNHEDRQTAARTGLPMMVGTPSGVYKHYDPATGVQTEIPPYVPTSVPPEREEPPSPTECSNADPC